LNQYGYKSSIGNTPPQLKDYNGNIGRWLTDSEKWNKRLIDDKMPQLKDYNGNTDKWVADSKKWDTRWNKRILELKNSRQDYNNKNNFNYLSNQYGYKSSIGNTPPQLKDYNGNIDKWIADGEKWRKHANQNKTQ